METDQAFTEVHQEPRERDNQDRKVSHAVIISDPFLDLIMN